MLKHKLTILDGGMGRELKRIGAPFSQPLWSAQALIESPEYVKKAHQHFIDAGAEIITASAYACVPFHLGTEVFASRGAELAKNAACIASALSFEAKLNNKHIRVAGTIPPAFGSYRPDLFDKSRAIHINKALFKAQEPHVDLWIAETLASFAEFEAAYEVLRHTEQPAFYSFTLDDNAPEAKLRSGQSAAAAAALVCYVRGAGIMFNCSVPEVMEQAIKEAKEIIDSYGTNTQIGVFANAFTPISNKTHLANQNYQGLRDITPAKYLEYAQTWYQAGASIIGGCCGIGPEHIQALREWHDTLAE